MGKKKRTRKPTNDPLIDALDEAPVAQVHSDIEDIAERPTSYARPVGEVLETLQAQTVDAMSGQFFDDGATTEITPVTKRMRSETGTVQVSAKRHDPAVEATVTIDVRCDHAEGDAGRYQLRATGKVRRENKDGDVQSNFAVPVEVREKDGAVSLDREEIREFIADAIRSTGTAREFRTLLAATHNRLVGYTTAEVSEKRRALHFDAALEHVEAVWHCRHRRRRRLSRQRGCCLSTGELTR